MGIRLGPALTLASLALTAYTLRRLRDAERDIVRTHDCIADHAKTQAIQSKALTHIAKLQQIDHFMVDILAAKERIAVRMTPEAEWPIKPEDAIAEADRIVKGGGCERSPVDRRLSGRAAHA